MPAVPMRACRAALAAARRMVIGAAVAAERAACEGQGVVYRLALSKDAAARLAGGEKGLHFVDLAPVGTMLVPGRRFGMAQGGEDGRLMVELTSPLTGEIVSHSCDPADAPRLLRERPGAWLVELDPLIEDGEEEDEWDELVSEEARTQ